MTDLAALTPGLSHEHGAGVSLELVLLLIAGTGVVAYVAATRKSRRRGREWPTHRVVLWTAGVVCATATVVGPLAAAAHGSFVAHMWAHLLIGMLAPVLLVLSAPVTLALRTLDAVSARRLSALLRSTPTRIVAHPVPAAVLSAGGLWLIYLTPLFELMHTAPVIHVLVHAHLLAAGYLFTNAVISLDPRPHPPGRLLTAIVFVVATASHSILAKYLYAHPPAFLSVADVQAGAHLMYYLGAWVEGAIIIVFCAQWYRSAGRRLSAPASLAAERVR